MWTGHPTMTDVSWVKDTTGHPLKYLVIVAYQITCMLVAIALHEFFELTGGKLILVFLLVAGSLLWVSFLPLYKRLHASPQD